MFDTKQVSVPFRTHHSVAYRKYEIVAQTRCITVCQDGYSLVACFNNDYSIGMDFDVMVHGIKIWWYKRFETSTLGVKQSKASQ